MGPPEESAYTVLRQVEEGTFAAGRRMFFLGGGASGDASSLAPATVTRRASVEAVNLPDGAKVPYGRNIDALHSLWSLTSSLISARESAIFSFVPQDARSGSGQIRSLRRRAQIALGGSIQRHAATR